MAIRYEISHDEGLIRVQVFGLVDKPAARELWSAVVAACDAHNCFDILGSSELEQPLSTMVALAHAEIFTEVGITRRHRIAWVGEDTVSQDMLEFTETVLLNRGKLTGGLFATVEEAKQWLYRKVEPQEVKSQEQVEDDVSPESEAESTA